MCELRVTATCDAAIAGASGDQRAVAHFVATSCSAAAPCAAPGVGRTGRGFGRPAGNARSRAVHF